MKCPEFSLNIRGDKQILLNRLLPVVMITVIEMKIYNLVIY